MNFLALSTLRPFGQNKGSLAAYFGSYTVVKSRANFAESFLLVDPGGYFIRSSTLLALPAIFLILLSLVCAIFVFISPYCFY
mmetsp:Transcript_16885/g.22739  ORF Transcript_16885/g.22739 Transcript_16885/m.22739 type:complete len:82 (+) Transcript_16885:116-361(+)